MKQNEWLIKQAKEIETLKKRLKEATRNNIPELYACFGKVLMEECNVSPDDFEYIVGRTQQIWQEMAERDEIDSMVQWCEECTGVELRGSDDGI